MARIHFIGICGTAMGTLAAMLKARGHHVQGSDAAVYPPMSEFLAAEEIVMRYVKGPGEKSVKRYNELRQEFQSIVGALTKRVSRK